MPEKIMFGYATLSSPDYMEALLGRIPACFPTTLTGYELGFQKFEDMPVGVKGAIAKNWNTPENFKSYFLKKTNNSSKIDGMAWLIDEKEEKILDDWEFKGLWYTKDKVEIEDKFEGKYSAFVFVINNTVGYKVPNYLQPLIHAFPVNKEKMLRLARENNLAARRERGEV